MITFEVNFGSLKGGQRVPKERIKRLLARTARTLKISDPLEISVAFVNENAMRRLNESYYGGTGVTDVLAFPSDQEHWASPYLGEILIYYPKAKKQALERGKTPRSEVELLLVHGLLHLLGYDHDTLRKKNEMFSLQDEIIASA